MLDLDEPDTPTQETNEQPAKQPAPRRRRAASRAAGPPSSAPDAPAIERVNPALGASQRGFRRDGDHAPGREGSQEASGQAHRQETTRGGSAGRR